jgi:voltage-gated potassium channel
MLWLVFITGTTVGYGGLVPKTMIGRSITIVVIVGGTFLMSIIIATMALAVVCNE